MKTRKKILDPMWTLWDTLGHTRHTTSLTKCHGKS